MESGGKTVVMIVITNPSRIRFGRIPIMGRLEGHIKKIVESFIQVKKGLFGSFEEIQAASQFFS